MTVDQKIDFFLFKIFFEKMNWTKTEEFIPTIIAQLFLEEGSIFSLDPTKLLISELLKYELYTDTIYMLHDNEQAWQEILQDNPEHAATPSWLYNK